MPECPLRSSTPAELSRRGWELVTNGQRESGLACHVAATALPAAVSYDWFHRGRAEQELGLDLAAEASYSRAVSHAKLPLLEAAAATEAYFQLGKFARDRRDLAQAEQSYGAAIALQPTAPGAHIMCGVTLREMGRTAEAFVRYSAGLRLQPSIPAAQYNRAQTLQELGRAAEALKGFRTTIELDPTFSIAYEAIGEAHLAAGRHTDALSAFQHVAATRPQSGAAYYSLGKAYFTTRQLELSIVTHQRALALPQTEAVPHAYVHNDLGNAISEISGRQDEVLHHYSMAAKLMPTFAEALSNVGTGFKERGRHEEAATRFQMAIGAKPTLCEAYKNLGSSYGELSGRLPEAVVAFEGALRINPQFWPALYAMVDTKQFLCDWRGRAGLLRKLTHHLDDLHVRQTIGAGPDERMHGGLAPFQTLTLPLSTSTQLAVTHNRARKDIALAAATPLRPPLRHSAASLAALRTAPHGPAASTSDSLRLGILSSDFGDHPVGHALLPWVRSLMRRRGLHVVCVASDSPERTHSGGELRRAIADACGAFYDVTTLSDAEAARVVDEQQLHLLINMVGHTAGARHVVTQWRPAPVQAMHYGYAATTALPAIGYMQLDRIAAPPVLHRDYTEKLAYFPHCHFVAVHAARYPRVAEASKWAHPWNQPLAPVSAAGRAAGIAPGSATRTGRRAASTADRRRVTSSEDGEAATRADLGLGRFGSRDDAFALCNFNQLYKMEPETFEMCAPPPRRLSLCQSVPHQLGVVALAQRHFPARKRLALPYCHRRQHDVVVVLCALRKLTSRRRAGGRTPFVACRTPSSG